MGTWNLYVCTFRHFLFVNFRNAGMFGKTSVGAKMGSGGARGAPGVSLIGWTKTILKWFSIPKISPSAPRTSPSLTRALTPAPLTPSPRHQKAKAAGRRWGSASGRLTEPPAETGPPPPAPARPSRTARSAARTGGIVTLVQRAQGAGEAPQLLGLWGQVRQHPGPDQLLLDPDHRDHQPRLLRAPSSSDHPALRWGRTRASVSLMPGQARGVKRGGHDGDYEHNIY